MRRNVLLLQGPVGPFFSRFADELESRGFHVTKVNFNGGDAFFYRRGGALDYTGKLEDWEAWLDRLLVNRDIGRIYLFGDCRAYHRIAREVARRRKVRIFVFEEGYIRPNFITLEEHGVNGYSMLMQRPLSIDIRDVTLPREKSAPSRVFHVAAIYSMIYYWASAFRRKRFSHYRHHRPFHVVSEGFRWLVSGWRKQRYARRQKHFFDELLPQFDGNYFVVPLQVHCDMQVVVHSDYNSIEHFIGEVLDSFCRHAPDNKAIVFKHHPMDRGYTDYSALFDNLVGELGLAGRVFYVHDVDLPQLLRHAEGSILINSTVGLSSLFHGTPVKVLGKAIYDIPGLTAQEELAEFWSSTKRVDAEFYGEFRKWLVQRNQLNGNLYRRIDTTTATGIVWSEELAEAHSWSEASEDVSLPPRLTVIDGGVGRGSRHDRSGGAEAA
ncbi:MAG: capsular biosynthesis protein [Gammaproteobacteria bacterium]|nr:MAG: capsular biosynthesis protein [Gammaproteobacteria bacterium]PIE36435.1 MAG: capsular biosynthesis protein [Gammaproteobacteria bacterium]